MDTEGSYAYSYSRVETFHGIVSTTIGLKDSSWDEFIKIFIFISRSVS